MLLVNPTHAQWWTSPYLSIGYLASVIRGLGEPVTIIDCQIEEKFSDKIIAELVHHDTIGFYTNVATINTCLDLIRRVRRERPRTRVILGGPQATAIFRELIPDYADIVVIGEGELTIREIIEEKPLSDIAGIAYWNKSLQINPRRPLIEDIDTIPLPAWDLIPLERYKIAHLPPQVNIITHRGCPFHCVNCTKSIHGDIMRYRSLDSVIEEIKYLVFERGIREIHIWDDNFTLRPKRVIEFCTRILDGNFPPLRFALLNGIRADVQHEDMFRIMRQAGFYWVSVAVESGHPDSIRFLKKKLRLHVVPNMIRMLKGLGYQTTLYFMFGLPPDTRSTIQTSIDFAKSLDADQIFWFMAQPFPGTEMFDFVEREGWFLRDMTMGYNSYDDGKSVFEMPHLRADVKERLFRKAYRAFYFRPSQLKKVLSKPVEDYSIDAITGLMRTGWRFLTKGARI